jgi:uncharacterized alpha-E superfamily protein
LNNLLARHAESIFWLARQVERANSTARILDVNETFSRNARGEHDWESVLRLYGDEQNFRTTGRKATAEAVLHFYILDGQNPNSVLSSVRMARENARALRPLISTEMWVQLNGFHNRLSELRRPDLQVENLNRLCSYIKESCQTHSGITAETLYRDESWYFHQLGRAIERADQTTRLVDVKYQVLLPRPSDVGSPIDEAQWNTVLRSAAGFHAFRRVNPQSMSPPKVVEFLVLDRRFPRSVAASVLVANEHLGELRLKYGHTAKRAASGLLRKLAAALAEDTAEDLIARGLHEGLDLIQAQLGAVTDALGREFFLLAETDEAAPPAGEVRPDRAPAAGIEALSG